LELGNNAGRFWCWRNSGGICIHAPSPLKAYGTHVAAGKKKKANLGDFLLFFLCVPAKSVTITCEKQISTNKTILFLLLHYKFASQLQILVARWC
jgi:hypothetical protein